MQRTFRVRGFKRYGRTIGLLPFVVIVPWLLWDAIAAPGLKTVWLALGALAMAAWWGYWVLFRTAYRIDMTDDSVVFTTTFGRETSALSQISSVNWNSCRLWRLLAPAWGTFIVVSNRRAFSVPRPMDGWHEFVGEIQRANPSAALTTIGWADFFKPVT